MENKIGYQYLKNEDFYEIIRRRKLKLDEVGFAIYLRGKYCYKGKNPFPLSSAYICEELGITKKILNKLKKKLQLKGVIKYDTFEGRGHLTLYTMLDTIMIPDRKGAQMETFNLHRKGAQMGNKTPPNGTFYKHKSLNNKHLHFPINIKDINNEISFLEGRNQTRATYKKTKGW